MVNYQNAKIYKLISVSNPEIVYYGSTCEKYLSCRMSKHTYDFRNQRAYYTAFEVLKFDDCEIILVESCPCTTKDELLAKENYYITNFQCVNKVKNLGLDYKKIHYKNNRTKCLERTKKHYEANREQKLKYAKEYREYIQIMKYLELPDK